MTPSIATSCRVVFRTNLDAYQANFLFPDITSALRPQQGEYVYVRDTEQNKFHYKRLPIRLTVQSVSLRQINREVFYEVELGYSTTDAARLALPA